MMYGSSPFTYGKTEQSAPKFAVNQTVPTPQGPGRVRASRFNGSGWEYGVEIVGLTKGGSVWFMESSLR
jgi:hypothetical protein